MLLVFSRIVGFPWRWSKVAQKLYNWLYTLIWYLSTNLSHRYKKTINSLYQGYVMVNPKWTTMLIDNIFTCKLLENVKRYHVEFEQRFNVL